MMEIHWKRLRLGHLLIAGLAILATAILTNFGKDIYQWLRPTPSTRNGMAFKEVSPGFTHTCAVSSKGIVYCWGPDLEPELGYHTSTVDYQTDTDHVHAPKAIALDATFTSVTAGDNHFCALTVGGQAFCWGYNFAGQLGTPRALGSCQDGSPCSDTPQPVLSPVFQKLSAGKDHTCGLSPQGKAYCWGRNDRGQLGDASDSDKAAPTPVTGGLTFRDLDAGYFHTCAITVDGAVYCWGSNDAGELGDGSTRPSSVPVRVHDTHRFRSVSAGSYVTCAIAIDNRAYCWGNNRHGTLGNGSATNEESLPVPVAGNHNFEVIDVGSSHACALDTKHRAYCWGLNDSGMLGDESTMDSHVPVPVVGDLEFVSLATGEYRTCAITRDRTIYCWGNIRLQPGFSEIDALRPTQVQFGGK